MHHLSQLYVLIHFQIKNTMVVFRVLGDGVIFCKKPIISFQRYPYNLWCLSRPKKLV